MPLKVCSIAARNDAKFARSAPRKLVERLRQHCYRWRQLHDPAEVDDARRVRELQVEVEQLKLLAAELMLDKRMLQDVAKKKW